MCQFIETICLKNGEFNYLQWHQKRVDETFRQFFPNSHPFCLKDEWINFNISKKSPKKQRIRVTYAHKINKIEVFDYHPKIIRSLSFIEVGDRDYSYKFKNREFINESLKNSGKDEVIFTRKGELLDSSIANLILRKNNQWFTPKTFWLNGTTRQRLIEEGQILPIAINLNNLHEFEALSFINAMQNIGESAEIPIQSIIIP